MRLQLPPVNRVRDALIQGTILAVDGFGNLITNLRPDDIPVCSGSSSARCRIRAGKQEITAFRTTFAEGTPGEAFIVPGSSGYLEIVVRDGSAAAALKLRPGDPVGAVLG